MAKTEKSGNAGATRERSAFFVALVLNIIPRAAEVIDTVGSVVGFRRWCKTMGISIYATREKLWEQTVLSRLGEENGSISIFEFGVAFGQASRWWLGHLPNSTLKFAGFDLFTGLPTAWRNLPAGAFNANGKTPEINDNRVTWYVGDVGTTIREVDWDKHLGQCFFIFDLDLFSPSLAVWDEISKRIKPGDLLYFDEAFDIDERLLLKNFLLPTNRFVVLGASPFGLVLQCKIAEKSTS